MMKEWVEPQISDLSVLNTEANTTLTTNHDGVMYDAVIQNDGPHKGEHVHIPGSIS